MRPAAFALAALVLGVALPAGAQPPRLFDVTLQASAPELAPARRSLAWAFVPFGVGQFANDSPVKGALFCVAETLAFSTFAASLGAFEANKVSGPLFGGGKFNDIELARKLEMAYLIAFWTGVAVAVVGVIDALVFRPSADTTVTVGPGAVAVSFY